MSEWLTFFIATRYPDAGFEIVDQHGHAYGRADTLRAALQLTHALTDAQDRRVADEASSRHKGA